jgi:hypothetical protein
MGFYVTNKRVKNFIKEHNLNQSSLIELNLCLGDLKEFPKENKNQIRFYEKVKKHLQISK